MPKESEHDFIFDFCLQFLESERFDAAVMDFVDEKCFIFENEEENKLEYTDIHREFSEHIEALISSNLGELGINTDMFVEACEKGRNSRDINKQVFERLMAMEDFETFKKLMVKRNMELQYEAIRAYSAATAKPSGGKKKGKKGRSAEDDYDEDRELEAALEASLQQSLSPLPVADELRALLEADRERDGWAGPGTGGKQLGEDDLQEILRRSLMEMEVLHRQEELEQADLEAAVAMSLALEEERLRLAREQLKREEKLRDNGPSSAPALGDAYFVEDRHRDRDRPSKDADEKEPSRPAPAAAAAASAAAASVSSPAAAPASSKRSAPDSSRHAADPPAKGEMAPARDTRDWDVEPAPAKSSAPSFASPEPEPDYEPSPSQHKASAGNGAAGDKMGSDFMDDSPSSRRAKPTLKPVGGKLSADAFAAPKPLQGRGLGGFSALPSISAVSEKRKQAEGEIRRAQEQLAHGRQQEEELRRQLDENDPDEAGRRARHMAEQRDRLIAMKKAEREKRVRAEEERQAKLSADGDEMPEAVLRAKAEAQARAREAKKNGGSSSGGDDGDDDDDDGHNESNEDRRRSAMRLALARRMKLDLIESEEMKLVQMQEDQFADLDRKLQQVEQLRRDNKQREQVMADQLRRQQATIARNVQRSAEELRRGDP